MQASAQEFRRALGRIVRKYSAESGKVFPSWRELRRLIRPRLVDRCKSCGESGGHVSCWLAVVDCMRDPLRESWPALSMLAELSALAATGLVSSDRRRMCQAWRQRFAVEPLAALVASACG